MLTHDLFRNGTEGCDGEHQPITPHHAWNCDWCWCCGAHELCWREYADSHFFRKLVVWVQPAWWFFRAQKKAEEHKCRRVFDSFTFEDLDAIKEIAHDFKTLRQLFFFLVQRPYKREEGAPQIFGVTSQFLSNQSIEVTRRTIARRCG